MAKYRKFRKSTRRRGRKYSLQRRSRTYKYSRRFRSENVHSYRLTKSVTSQLSVGSTVAASGALIIDPTTFGNFTELQTLYDQYLVKSVTVNIRPAFAPVQSDATTLRANYDAYLFTCLDFDSLPGTALTRSAIQQYRNMRKTSFARIHRRTWKPKALGIQYYVDSSGVTSASNKGVGGWIDLAMPMPMTNLYYYIDPMNPDTPTDQLIWNIDYTLHVACKNVR